MKSEEKFDVKSFVYKEVGRQLGIKPTEVAGFHLVPNMDSITAKYRNELLGVPITTDSSVKSPTANMLTVDEVVEFLDD